MLKLDCKSNYKIARVRFRNRSNNFLIIIFDKFQQNVTTNCKSNYKRQILLFLISFPSLPVLLTRSVNCKNRKSSGRCPKTPQQSEEIAPRAFINTICSDESRYYLKGSVASSIDLVVINEREPESLNAKRKYRVGENCAKGARRVIEVAEEFYSMEERERTMMMKEEWWRSDRESIVLSWLIPRRTILQMLRKVGHARWPKEYPREWDRTRPLSFGKRQLCETVVGRRRCRGVARREGR